jgi:alpha-beta hydrolase superfamily lysophospholipase
MHALNGFEVQMVDFKGFGYSSGPRVGGFSTIDAHEQIGSLLQRVRTDKPLFVIGHSMGC